MTRSVRCQSIPRAMVALLVVATNARAQIVSYTDETSYLNALALEGFSPVHESFEDDAAWGTVRSTAVGGSRTAFSITSQGITWASSSPSNEITTGAGAARTGMWGFYSLPHGDYANAIGDGFSGSAAQPLVAVGGWIETNTPPAKIGLFLDGNPSSAADFGDADALGTQSRFFGVIHPAGFTRFDFRELEGTIGDQKLVFADDFTVAFGGTLEDCNRNGVADGQDVYDGSSPDCNRNGAPDECEIDANSTAPGGPYFCTESCDPDCNRNGVPDACEVVTPVTYASGELSPVGDGSPQSFTIPAPPITRADALLEFTAYANLGGASEHVAVDINGVRVGTVFGADGSDCPESLADSAQITVPAAAFNAAVDGGDAVLTLTASAEVDGGECDDPSYITVAATLFVSSDSDADGNGIPDECQGGFRRGDSNADGTSDISDPIFVLVFLFAGGGDPPCHKSADADDNGELEATDAVFLLSHLFRGGPAPGGPFAVCGSDATTDGLSCDSYPPCG